MNKQPPSTEVHSNQVSTDPGNVFFDGPGALPPYTPEELARQEIDRQRTATEEIARRAATTLYLAEKKAQAGVQLAKIIPIAQAPSYHTRKIEQVLEARAQATPQEW